jgi:hypothetical protein
MTDTPPALTVPPAPTLRQILAQLALPFFLFALVLATLLTLSAALLLPIFTKVEVGGKQHTAGELRSLQMRLSADITRKEQERDVSVLPFQDRQFETVSAERDALPTFVQMRQDVLHAAAAITPEQDAVHVSSIRFAEGEKTLEVGGDVRNVGERSMTVLAQFVRELEHMPAAAGVRQPDFQRLIDPQTGPHSPFTITLILR